MSRIGRLFTHQVRVYRSPTTQDAFNEPSGSWTAQGDAPTKNNARPEQAWKARGSQEDRGAGEEQQAERRWFLSRGLSVQERDVLDVTSGPELPSGGTLRLRVMSVTPQPTRRARIHHIEVDVEVYEGNLS